MEKIHIALSFENENIEQIIVLMTSVLANKTDEKIHFHIIDGGIGNANKKKIFELKNCEITFHIIGNKEFCLSVLADIISEDKLIYLDKNTIVNSSLKELWVLELEDNYIGAAEDSNSKKYAKKYRLLRSKKFFNTDVMLINCQKWRQDSISRLASEIMIYNSGTESGCEQTVLNKLFEGKVKFLDLKWNLQCCPVAIFTTYAGNEDYKEAFENPAIINYTGKFKPWKKVLGTFNPKQEDYFKYLKMTSYDVTQDF